MHLFVVIDLCSQTLLIDIISLKVKKELYGECI